MSVEPYGRRRLLAEGVAFAIKAYVQAGSLWDPRDIASNALEVAAGRVTEYRARQENQPELNALASQIRNLKARFDEDKLVIRIEMKTMLELIERMLRMSFARQDAAATGTFRTEFDGDPLADYDGELVLPNRSIFVKFVTDEKPFAQLAVSYLKRAIEKNPSECWLLTSNPGRLDIPFAPIFTEGKVSRGKLRIMGLSTVITEIVGTEHEVRAEYARGSDFKFEISRKGTPTVDA